MQTTSTSDIANERTTLQKMNMKFEISNDPLALDNDFTYGYFENRQHSPTMYDKLSSFTT